jgi:hypothetical protein
VRTQLFDPARHWQVLRTLTAQATVTAPVLLAAVGSGALLGAHADKEIRRIARTGFTALVLMLAVYFAVYVVTPHDLTWHVSTTLDRLLVQIAPLAILTLLLVAASPDERRRAVIPARVSQSDRASPRRRRRAK